jgi:hypothetical protein
VADSPAPPVVDRPAGPEPDERPNGRRRFWLTAAAVFTALTFGLYVYAFFFYDPGLLIDELPDKTFPTAAEKVCASAQAQLEALPLSTSSRTAAERADVVDRANVILRDMVAQLEPLVPQGQGRITTGVQEWVSDWSAFIDDRQAYADGLRKDPDTRFVERRKANRQISLAIDSFAQVNRMDSCVTPGDVG